MTELEVRGGEAITLEEEKRGFLLTPGTGISIAMMVTIISAAIWIVSGQVENREQVRQLKELVLDIRTNITANQTRIASLSNQINEQERWVTSEMTKNRMGMNEARRAVGLPPIGEGQPYLDGATGGARRRSQ